MTTHFNPWRGCTKVSPGCENCYADTMSKRNPKTLGVWGANGTRVVASPSYWNQPRKWNEAAKSAGERHRVFCASLADVFEGPETMPEEAVPRIHAARVKLFHLISETKHLDWLLLTKRPENVLRHCGNGLPRSWSESMPSNIWLGVSIEDQQRASRLHHLAEVRATVKFVSYEPALGPLVLSGKHEGKVYNWLDPKHQRGVHWVICGGESGSDARAFQTEWARSLRDQCKATGVPFFMKQLGADVRERELSSWPDSYPYGKQSLRLVGDGFGNHNVCGLKDKKGGDESEWPEDLRVRQFPITEAP